MDDACRKQVKDALASLPQQPRRVVEFGSQNINGTVRDYFRDAEYIGVDPRNGDGVDVVADACKYTPPWDPDLVLCLNVLEHTPRGKKIIANGHKILAPGGTMLICAAGRELQIHGWRGEDPNEWEWYAAYTPSGVEYLLRDFDGVKVWEDGGLVYGKGMK